MKLLECYVENFGKLSSYKHVFTDGLNVIVGTNGCGKTTLSVFIKSMFYGIDSKKTKNEETDRKRYLPWQGGRYGGSLTFESESKRYRIERTFGERASADTFAVYNAETGAPSADFSENIGAELFGIDADGFERTVFLSEKKFTVKNNNQTISAKLSNLVGVDGEMGNFDQAIEMLEKKEKYYRHRRGGGGLIGEIKSDISELDSELYDISRKKDEYDILENELVIARQKAESAEQKKKEHEAKALDGAYKKEYAAKVKALRYYEEKIAGEKEFFHNKAVNAGRLREFEEKYNRLRLLKADFSKKETTSASDILQKIKTVDEHIEAYNMSENGKNANKSYYIWFVSAVVTAILSSILGVALTPVLFLLLLLSTPCLFLGIKEKGETQKNEKIRSELLLPVFDFVAKKTGRSVGRENLYIALLEIKANLSSEMREAERLSEEKRKKAEEIESAERECATFLSDFSVVSTDPFGEIREHLATYEILLLELNAKAREAELYAKEYSILPGSEEGTFDSSGGEPISYDPEADFKRAREAYYSLENKCIALSDEISREDEINERRLELTDSLTEAEATHRLIVKASEHLLAAKEHLTEKYLGKMRSAFDRYIDILSSESGNLFAIDTDFALRKTENGLTNPTESYSLGTKELYSLATRFALTDALYDVNSPFIILDDPICQFDDKKCKSALQAIASISNEKQIIYLTCSESRTPN